MKRTPHSPEFKEQALRKLNKAQLHSTLVYVSPMQFEQTWLAAQAVQASS
jgi:hypothetical protein